MNFFEKLKLRWQITSNFQLIMICVVFAITGSAAAWLSKPVLAFLNIDKSIGLFPYWVLRILILFPIYQILLVVIGTLLGQHTFFWNFEKKMLKRFGINLDKKTEQN